MKRRAFIASLTGGLLAAPLAAKAQQAGKVPRIGILIPTVAPPAPQPWLDAFRETLRGLGHVEGQTIRFEVRWSPVEIGRYEEPLLSLIRLPVAVGHHHPDGTDGNPF